MHIIAAQIRTDYGILQHLNMCLPQWRAWQCCNLNGGEVFPLRPPVIGPTLSSAPAPQLREPAAERTRAPAVPGPPVSQL